jgi:3-demethoxyubiquinol 3-hydroxylase
MGVFPSIFIGMRQFTAVDKFLEEAQYFLDTLQHAPKAARANPGTAHANSELNATETRISQGCMRVNHTGEICAQALYRGQAFGTSNQTLKRHFNKAAQEEADHLNWCQERLDELNTHTSYLNPFWYCASFLIGIAAARLGDDLSLGFVEETEQQVIQHLTHHQKILPNHDAKSHAIISVMREDEAAHAQEAHLAGAKKLPALLKLLMQCQSKVMTSTAYHI